VVSSHSLAVLAVALEVEVPAEVAADSEALVEAEVSEAVVHPADGKSVNHFQNISTDQVITT
jgi:hypothetical protein